MKKIAVALILATSLAVFSSCGGNSGKKNLAIIETVLEATKGHTPMTVATGMVMTDVRLEDGYFTYYYECEEPLYDMDKLQNNSELAKKDVKAALALQHDSMVLLLSQLKAAGMGIAYKYIGTTSGKVCIVHVECEEFDEL